MGRIIILITAVVASAASILITYFFNILNERSTIELYERLPLFFSVSRYTFLFWIFVIGALFYWIHMYVKARKTEYFITRPQTLLFVLVSIFQIASLIVWREENYFISILLVIVQLLLLFILYMTYPISNDTLKLRAPIAIYFSWVTFDFFIKVSYLLVFIEWNGFGLSNALWAVIFMTVGVAVCLHLRYHHFDIAFPLVFIWGYVGIMLKNGLNELFVTAAALFLTGVLIFGTIYFKKNPKKLRV